MNHLLKGKNDKVPFKVLLEILLVSTKLGFISFGGPIAHLGYFYEEYIRRRKWMEEKTYAELVALCQFLPGPASSQVGIGIGIMRGGILGGIISFIGFTTPSVIALILFALIVQHVNVTNAGWIHGLKIVAVAVVAHAILGMAQKLMPDLKRKAIAIFAISITLLWQTPYAQFGIILLSAVLGYLFYKQSNEENSSNVRFPISKTLGVVCLLLFFGLLIALPILRGFTSSNLLVMFDSFYRSGSLVFGGGHVVLPLLEREFVPSGFISEEVFLAGYGATQAVPGPLFTFAAYIGAVMNGWFGGLVATIAIFLPAFLLVFGTLPFWDILRRNGKVKGALMSVNAAVVGILIAAFYNPIFTSAILQPIDFVFAIILFSLLSYWKLSPWIIVVIGVLGGIFI